MALEVGRRGHLPLSWHAGWASGKALVRHGVLGPALGWPKRTAKLVLRCYLHPPIG